MNQGYAQGVGSMLGGYGAAQSSYPPETAPARQLEVPAGVSRLENSLTDLACTLDVLDNRLSGYVARSNPPAKEASTQLKGALATGLGQQLDGLTERTQALHRRMNDLLERLEA